MNSLLEISEVTVSFAGVNALANASMRVEAGEVVAVIGPNGAGKSTLLNAITGIVQPTSGTIRLGGHPITGLPPSQIAQAGVRRTFQNGGLFSDMTVLENILTGLHSEIAGNAWGLVFGGSDASRAERAAVQRALSFLDTMHLSAFAEARVSSLSGGQQRIVEFIRTIAARPRLLLLDEPAVGLSPAARLQLTDTVRTLARRENVGVVLIEHAIDLVMQIADRIVVFSSGTKIADGPPEKVRHDPVVLEAYLGSTLGTRS